MRVLIWILLNQRAATRDVFEDLALLLWIDWGGVDGLCDEMCDLASVFASLYKCQFVLNGRYIVCLCFFKVAFDSAI